MLSELRKQLLQQQAHMLEDRRALHQIPELGWNLPQTTAYLTRRLEAAGLEVEVFQSKILAVQVGAGPRTVLVRAEMDALPVQETSGLPFRSHNRNSHSSGHDLHMAMLLALARVLKANEARLPGRVVLLFQPAGEGGMGAKFMVERGFLEHYGIRYAMALHTDISVPYGPVGYHPGLITAYLDGFLIQIQGKGGRGYSPYDAVSPLEIAAHIQLMLGSLIQRELPPCQQAILSVGKAGGGVVANQIPDQAVVEGTFRCLDSEVRQYLRSRVEGISHGLCAVYRGSCTIDYVSTPAMYNDPKLYALLSPVLQNIMGPDYVPPASAATLSAEDFSYVAQYIPTAFFRLGADAPARPGTFDERVLGVGARILLDSLFAIWQQD